MIERQILAGAMPTCGQDGCDQPWIRVEMGFYQNGDGDWLPNAHAVCEYGHRIPVDPIDPED